MVNGEKKHYRGYTIEKLHGNDYRVGWCHYPTYNDAKKAIDIEEAENEALRDIDHRIDEIRFQIAEGIY